MNSMREIARCIRSCARPIAPRARRMRAARQTTQPLLLPVESNLKRQRYTLIFNPLALVLVVAIFRTIRQPSFSVANRLRRSTRFCESASVPSVGFRLGEAVTECAMRRMHPAHTRDPHESQGYALAR